MPKPELTDEEKAALHNVTSSLYNRPEVKNVVEKATEAVCKALGVPVPEKKGRSRGKDRGDRDGNAGGKEEREKVKKREDIEAEKDRGEVARKGKKSKEKITAREDDDGDDEEEEKAVSQLDAMLGLGSDEEEDDEEEEKLVKGRRKRPTAAVKDLDPMEITTDEEDGEQPDNDDDLDPMEVTSDDGSNDGSDDGSDDSSDDSSEFEGFSDPEQASGQEEEDASDSESSASSIARSPPAKKAASSKKAAKSKPRDSTFLPTLMGGYISGSESEASDIDVAPARKNRRGQRARQAIWEKKYKDKAKHLQKQAAKGRDAGWDPKRGAVDGDSKPWKRGIRNPLLDKSKKGSGSTQAPPPKREPPKRTRDDSGPLHPSWEAKRLAREKERLTAPFQGRKITFD